MGIFKLAFCLSERKNGEVTLDYVAGKPLKASIHAVNKRHESRNLLYWPPARMRNWLSPFLSAWHPQDMWCMGTAVFGRKMWTCSVRRSAIGSSSPIRQPGEQTWHANKTHIKTSRPLDTIELYICDLNVNPDHGKTLYQWSYLNTRLSTSSLSRYSTTVVNLCHSKPWLFSKQVKHFDFHLVSRLLAGMLPRRLLSLHGPESQEQHS